MLNLYEILLIYYTIRIGVEILLNILDPNG